MEIPKSTEWKGGKFQTFPGEKLDVPNISGHVFPAQLETEIYTTIHTKH
jgi:hypothetical protein